MKNFVICVLDTILFNFLPLSIILLKWDYLSNYRNKIHLGGYSHRWSIIGGCWYNDHRSWNCDRFPSLVITYLSNGDKQEMYMCPQLLNSSWCIINCFFSSLIFLAASWTFTSLLKQWKTFEWLRMALNSKSSDFDFTAVLEKRKQVIIYSQQRKKDAYIYS